VNTYWLPRALEDSRARGFLGPNAIEPHIEHAIGFARCWEQDNPQPPAAFADLGSGGGLPALVLLERWNCKALMTESMEKRAKFLIEVLGWEGAPKNGEVVIGRVEEIARREEFVEAFDLVTSRSFGPPAVTAECGVRFLKIGGMMIVSEPPDDDAVNRWDPVGLKRLGLESLGRVRFGAAFQVLRKVRETPAEYPRTIGTPGKRPLF
jgi:16S rRNA (guanine527-N7)-methyltransferase